MPDWGTTTIRIALLVGLVYLISRSNLKQGKEK